MDPLPVNVCGSCRVPIGEPASWPYGIRPYCDLCHRFKCHACLRCVVTIFIEATTDSAASLEDFATCIACCEQHEDVVPSDNDYFLHCERCKYYGRRCDDCGACMCLCGGGIKRDHYRCDCDRCRSFSIGKRACRRCRCGRAMLALVTASRRRWRRPRLPPELWCLVWMEFLLD